MKGKSVSAHSAQEELPLGNGTPEGGLGEGVKKTSIGRYERRVVPAVFEFEEVTAESPREPDRGAVSDTVTELAGTAGTSRSEGASDQKPRAESLEAGRLFEEAKRASGAGRVEEAARLYRQLISLDPSHVRARNNLGVLVDQMGDHEVAMEHLRAALELEPENGEVLANLGAVLAAQGKYEQAEAQMRRAARIDPASLDVRANLGLLYFRRGLNAQADLEFRWVCEQDPNHALAHFYRGEALNRLGRIDEALDVLEQAARLQPQRSRIYYLMGILYDRKNLRQEAAAMYKTARELSDP
jgi:Tfp pilus assembly protein PilF